MELVICQSCGHILRNRAKACAGCGNATSKFAATALPSASNGRQAPAMSVEMMSDPLVLERTVNRIIYGNGNGNGGNGYSSGGFLYESLDWRPTSAALEEAASYIEPVSGDIDSPTSRLTNILGGAALGAGAGNAAAAAFSSMLEMGDDQAGSDFVPEGPDDFLPEPEVSQSTPVRDFDDALPYENDFSDAAEREEALPVATRGDIVDEDRDRPGDRTILPGRFLTPGVKEGTFFASRYVDRRDSGYEVSQQLEPDLPPEPNSSDFYDDDEPGVPPDSVVSSASASDDSDDDFFDEDETPRVADPVAQEEASRGFAETAVPVAAVAAAAGTAFAAGAALAAARSAGAGDDFFSSTVPGAAPASVPPPVASASAAPVSDFVPPSSVEPAVAPVVAAAAVAVEPVAAAIPSAVPSSGMGGFSPGPQSDFLEAPPAQQTSTAAALIPDAGSPVAAAAAVPTPESIMPFQPQPQPAMMDFFAATGGGFFSAGASPSPVLPQSQGAQPQLPPQPDQGMFPGGMSDLMGGGGTASIIQNAIQAGARAAANSQAKSEVDVLPPSSADSDEEAPKSKRSSRKSEKSGTKSSGSKNGADKSDSKKNKSSKAGTGKSSLAAARTKSGSGKGKKKGDSDEDGGDKITVGGLSLPKKMAAIAACMVIFVAFPVFVLISNLASIIGGLPGGVAGGAAQTSNKGMSLTGNWQIAYANPDGSQVNGIMSLTQKGDTIEGWGNDPKATFQVGGKLAANQQGKVQIQLNKQYLSPQNQPLGKPIVYFGVIDGVNPAGPYFMHISGVWKFQKRQGYSWRAQIVELTGKWEAALTNPGAAQSAGTASGPSVSVRSGNAQIPGMEKDPKSAHQVFLNIAIGLLAVGGIIAMLSLKIFGPSGVLNILAKKEYIPSQFKSQHFKLVREMGRPLKKGGVPIGTRCEWNLFQFWMPRELALPPAIRESNPHVLIIGQGAKGKSRLMATMIAHDIESADRAVIVVDSDGSLVDLVMNWMAAHPNGKQMSERVIVIDPTRDGDNMCYNPLQFPEDGDLQNAASAIVFGFKAIYTEPPGSQSQWNQQTANILRNCSILLMANGKTLTDLPVLLSDNDQRDLMLEKVERMKGERTEYTTLIDAWANYKRLARTDQWINWIEPILNRVQPMLGDPRIRPILTEAKGDLNISEVIKQKQVLFVKIPQGQLDQNGNLLGSLIVTGVKQAALSLSKQGEKKRPCALYLDEFDNFIEKETFDAITTETRKFQVGLCSVAKTLQGLPEDYRNQIIANIGTMAVFSLTKKDGDMLGPQMFRVDGRKVKHQTIQNVFNKVNTSPQFELISDEEKLNIDRVVAQEERTYFFYRVGSVAGVFNMKAPEFKDVQEKDINYDLIDQMFENRQEDISASNSSDDDDEDEEDE